MVPHRLPVIWLNKLLVLCRRWASYSLKALLVLLSRLSQWLDLHKTDDGISSDDGRSSQAVLNNRGDRAGVHLRSDRKTIPQSATENAFVLSYSSMPIVPQPVHIQGRLRYMDSLSPGSPTLLNERCSSSELGYEAEDKHPESSRSTGGACILTHGRLIAEPEHITAEPMLFTPVFTPMAPSSIPRYFRGVTIENNRDSWRFKPLGTLAISKLWNQQFGPWQYHVHPEGQPYYSYKQDLRRFSYLTEADASKPDIQAKLDQFIDAIERKANDPEFTAEIPSNVEVALEIQDDEWQYYMVDLDQRTVFWLDEFDVGFILGPDEGVESQQHLYHKLATEFWIHIEMFPISPRSPLTGLFDELLDILTYFNIDSISSMDSTTPYGKDVIQSVIGSVRHLQSTSATHPSSFAIVCSARLMGVISNERFLNFYGFEGARLSTLQSVRSQATNKRSWLVKCLSPMLFYAPDTHLRRLEKLWIDGVMRHEKWKTFQAKLETDWNEFVLYSTVLLNANVAFLSIPNVDSDNGPTFWSSPAAVASLVSTIASLASIIVGLLLGRQLRISSKNDGHSPDDAINYLSRRKHNQLGLETVAIQYSLPYALLMWGMVTFAAAIAIICFYKVDATPNLLTRMIYTGVWLFIVPLILWTVLTGWETTNKSSWRELPMISAEWWKEHVRCDPATIRNSLQLRLGRAKKDPEECMSLAETATANNCDSNSTAPRTTAEKRRLRMRFGPVRRLTESIGRRFSRP